MVFSTAWSNIAPTILVTSLAQAFAKNNEVPILVANLNQGPSRDGGGLFLSDGTP